MNGLLSRGMDGGEMWITKVCNSSAGVSWQSQDPSAWPDQNPLKGANPMTGKASRDDKRDGGQQENPALLCLRHTYLFVSGEMEPPTGQWHVNKKNSRCQ